MKSLCVFCGSSLGANPAYLATAKALGKLLAERGIRLVYGGASVGIMGAIADTVLENGGTVTGVIPQALVDKEVAHYGLTELHIVESMHQRKALMAELSDGFIALPGGFGTLEELFEVLTWSQLGLHQKPVAVLNVEGFYDGLLSFINNAMEQKYLKPVHRDLLLQASDAESAIKQLSEFVPQDMTKWITPQQS